MTEPTDLLRALRLQAAGCGRLGSPFYEALLGRIADDVEAGGPVTALLQPWLEASFRQLFDDAVMLRVANAFNHLALGEAAPALAAVWPRRDRAWDIGVVWAAARAEITRHFDQLAAFMTHEPQTNEVRRSIALIGGFLTVAAETGLPLRSFEVGASAGLNQYWDRFHYDFGAGRWGDADASVRIDAEWSGDLPPLVPIRVIERGACDRRPTDLRDLAQCGRLLACIWPDQFDRLERSRAAIDLALASGASVETADALDWTHARVAPQTGTATVLFHSVFWQYLPAETQAGLKAEIERIGDTATPDAPFAWLAMEPTPGDMIVMQIRLRLWPGGEERILAQTHPHGSTVRWLGG